MRVTKGLYLLTILLFVYSQMDIIINDNANSMFVLFIALNFFLMLNSFFCTALIAMLTKSRDRTKFWDNLLSFWMVVHIVIIIAFSLYYLDYILIIILLCFLGSLVAIPTDDKLDNKKSIKK